MEGFFLEGWHWDRGGGLGRARLFSGGRGLWVPPREASQPAFSFLSGHWGDQHQDKALRTLAHRLHYNTHDRNDNDDFLCQQHHRSGIAHITLSTNTHSQGRRSRPREGLATRRAAKY